MVELAAQFPPFPSFQSEWLACASLPDGAAFRVVAERAYTNPGGAIHPEFPMSSKSDFRSVYYLHDTHSTHIFCSFLGAASCKLSHVQAPCHVTTHSLQPRTPRREMKYGMLSQDIWSRWLLFSLRAPAWRAISTRLRLFCPYSHNLNPSLFQTL